MAVFIRRKPGLGCTPVRVLQHPWVSPQNLLNDCFITHVAETHPCWPFEIVIGTSVSS
jgi:hypothetical protein